MALFNKKTIRRHVGDVPTIPEMHLTALSEWAQTIETERIFSLSEIQLHGDFKNKIIVGVLGYQTPGASGDWTVAQEQPIGRGSVDLALGWFAETKAEILAPFELKGARVKDLDAIMPGRNKSPVQQAWEYAISAQGVKWVLVSNYMEIRLYAFGQGIQNYEVFDLRRLSEPFEYARFMLLLSAENFLGGRTANLLEESREANKDITNRLYDDYKALRATLIEAVRKSAPGVDPLTSIAVGQAILDRVLFVAFAEDTALLPRNIIARAYEHADPFNPRPIWDNFKGLFRAIDSGNPALQISRYNGGLFAADPNIDGLTLPDGICEGFKRLAEYDFASEVGVTILGRIFEQSITDIERLQARARGEEVGKAKVSGTTGRRKRDGVVYTPDYIAHFIVEKTVGTHLREIFYEIVTEYAHKGANPDNYESIKWKRKTAEREAWEAYQTRISSLRIVDPACGSGVFLVTAFDYLRAELERVNTKVAELKGIGGLAPGLFDPDREILSNNLYGVDVNAESIEIAKLSLWIKTARVGKVLDSLDGHLKVGDSLIEDSNFAYLEHGFTWREAFPDVFAEGGFDIVLGNPPYVRMELLKAMKPYLEGRFEVVSDRADLYAYFFERGLKLLKPGGRMGYISSSTFFKTGSAKPLREFLLRTATLESVVDFGDLQVFEGVTTYPAILTMKNRTASKGHELRFWMLDSIPRDEFNAAFDAAAESYPQSALGPESWEFENPALRRLRQKVRAGKPTLQEIYGSPCRGIVTGLNEAFVIDRETRDRLIAEAPKSAELLKPFLEGKDLKRWRTESRDLWLIYIPKNRVDIESYPAIKAHLFPFKGRLEKRATKQEWFELQQAQEAYEPHFLAPKISYPHFSVERLFVFEPSGAFSNDKSYLIPTSDRFLLALLNSAVAWFIIRSLAPAVRGGFHEMRVQYLEQVPVPRATDIEKATLAKLAEECQGTAEECYRRQIAVRRRISDLCPADRSAKLTNKLRDWWEFPNFAAFRTEVNKTFKTDIPLADRSDWEDWIKTERDEINRLTNDISRLEAEINTRVYDLFDLTPEEVRLLEANV